MDNREQFHIVLKSYVGGICVEWINMHTGESVRDIVMTKSELQEEDLRQHRIMQNLPKCDIIRLWISK